MTLIPPMSELTTAHISSQKEPQPLNGPPRILPDEITPHPQSKAPPPGQVAAALITGEKEGSIDIEEALKDIPKAISSGEVTPDSAYSLWLALPWIAL